MRTARLARLFDSIVLCALAAPAIGSACSSSEPSANNASGGNAGAAAADASIEQDGGDLVDACTPYVADVEIIVFPDGNGACHAHHRHPCGFPDGVALVDGCVFRLNDCLALCPISGAYECYAAGGSCVDGSLASGPATVTCDFCSSNVGRRPRGLRRNTPESASSPLGDYFARIAHLEAASVIAFDELAKDLAALRAPHALQSAVRGAERDERRHARMTGALARRFGGRAAAVQTRRRRRSTLAQIALENAIEGCVRETFGALVATWQARHATDRKLARALTAIARDETRHAALAWQIQSWCDPRLSPRERSRVRRALSRAIRALERELAEPHRDLVSRAGVPNLFMQQKLFAALASELWSQ